MTDVYVISEIKVEKYLIIIINFFGKEYMESMLISEVTYAIVKKNSGSKNICERNIRAGLRVFDKKLCQKGNIVNYNFK